MWITAGLSFNPQTILMLILFQLMQEIRNELQKGHTISCSMDECSTNFYFLPSGQSALIRVQSAFVFSLRDFFHGQMEMPCQQSRRDSFVLSLREATLVRGWKKLP